MNPNCPRCHSQALVPLCGGGRGCLACGYEEVEESLELCAELMVTAPGMPLSTRAERHDAPKKGRQNAMALRWQGIRIKDLALAAAAARDLGVTLAELRDGGKERQISDLRHRVIEELRMLGLGPKRIGYVLDRNEKAIRQSLARSRR